MSQQFLVLINSVIVGPITLEQVESLIEKKQIKEDTFVCRESERSWKTAADLEELKPFFPKTKEQPKEFVPPFAQTQASADTQQIPRRKQREQVEVEKPKAQDLQQNTSKLLPAIDIEPVGNDIRFKCPHCFQQYAVNMGEFVNARITCQKCYNPMLIGPDILDARNTRAPQTPPEEKSPEPPKQPQQDMENVFAECDYIPGNIVCPHCWTKFDKKSVLYVSTHPDLLGDPVAGDFEQRRFSPTVYNADGLPLDERGIPCTDMACPVCHLRLPADSIDCKASFFSIVGAPSSGKSYYLTALVHTLRKVMPECFDCSFYDADPLINSVVNNYESIIFGSTSPMDVVSLPKTQLSGGDFSTSVTIRNVSINLPKPFIFRAQPFNVGDTDAKWNRTVVFYDNAGEHFQPGNDNFNNPATQHLAHSNGIIFLFDPINDPQMRRICLEEDPQRKISNFVSAQTSIFAEMVARIRRHGNLTANQMTDIPLIIAVNKFDAWMDALHFGVRNTNPLVPDFDKDNNLKTALDVDMTLSVSFAVREIMMKYAPGIVSQAETLFKHVWFVPVSSFGCIPTEAENGRIGVVPQDISPIWVEIPVAILFYENGLVPRKARKGTPVNKSPLMAKASGEHIVFVHPVTGARISLPSLYANAILNIGGEDYLMPNIATGKKVSTGAKNTVEWS